MKPSIKQARIAARDLLNRMGVTRPPVPVDEIADRLGIVVHRAVMDDELSGMAYINNDTSIIGINSIHHPNRQRFSISHELGHHVLHRSAISAAVHVDKGFRVLYRDSNSSYGIDNLEIEANAFAAELLMPENMLISSVNIPVFDIDDEDMVEELSKRFRVSAAAMRYRLSSIYSL